MFTFCPGRIVIVSSAQGRLAVPSNSAYAITKYGLECFSDILRLELQCFGVKVVVVEPGNFGGSTGMLNPLAVCCCLLLCMCARACNFVVVFWFCCLPECVGFVIVAVFGVCVCVCVRVRLILSVCGGNGDCIRCVCASARVCKVIYNYAYKINFFVHVV